MTKFIWLESLVLTFEGVLNVFNFSLASNSADIASRLILRSVSVLIIHLIQGLLAAGEVRPFADFASFLWHESLVVEGNDAFGSCAVSYSHFLLVHNNNTFI